ncbi:unnamed protein product [Brassicogethes aeneus]|uniref:DUF7869 domain-containing protein n=1 Tax=Brassicogethes aeneus TaxID=1431903 RepID=A0A9P0AU93_BRAAE|nr:unnamed protein product [Brassicogethes aeneus]
MHKHFQENYPSMTVSYAVYRQEVADQNISFVKLGHEECCQKWNTHIQRANLSREAYQQDSKSDTEPGRLIVSADLQKVIMLPRLDMFKEVIFTPIIIAFNESFVPVDSNKEKLCAILWHEAISGRSKSDITCAFHRFLSLNQDAQKIIFWLDNCSAQNKNWGLFCFFVHMINCNDIAAQQIDLKYFEPGHTFMSADSFDHQVEHSLKKRKGL